MHVRHTTSTSCRRMKRRKKKAVYHRCVTASAHADRSFEIVFDYFRKLNSI